MSYSALSICISLVLSPNILLSSEYAHGSHSLGREKIDLLLRWQALDCTFEDCLNQAKELLFERRYSAAEQTFKKLLTIPLPFAGVAQAC